MPSLRLKEENLNININKTKCMLFQNETGDVQLRIKTEHSENILGLQVDRKLG
jgi:hypothetical protein